MLYVFLKFSSYFSSVRQFPIGLIVLNEKLLCVLQSRLPNEQVVPLLSLLWSLHMSSGHDGRSC